MCDCVGASYYRSMFWKVAKCEERRRVVSHSLSVVFLEFLIDGGHKSRKRGSLSKFIHISISCSLCVLKLRVALIYRALERTKLLRKNRNSSTEIVGDRCKEYCESIFQQEEVGI